MSGAEPQAADGVLMEVVGRPLTHVGGVGAAAAKPAATQASSLQPLASMKLPALKDELRARGHSTGGKKEELVEQLTLLRAAAKSQVQRMRRESLACAVGSNE